MKLFRRISALALAVIMICLLSASAFAATMTNTIHYNGGDLQYFASVYQKYLSADLVFDTEDAVGNYLSIDVEYRYYMYSDDDGNPIALTNVRTATAEDRDVWSCSLTKVPAAPIYQMQYATYTFYGEFTTPAYGEQICTPTPITIPYQ